MTQTAESAAARASKTELLRGTVIAALVAGLVLTVAVLPAEYGIDPTGAGKALGLTAMHATPPAAATAAGPSAAPAAPAAPAPKGSTVSAPGEVRAQTIVARQSAKYRTDVQEVTLAPGRGLEVKTRLAKGGSLIFSWKTENGALVDHDFHGEPVNAKEDEFESFIDEKAVSHSSGALIAPFTGLHGWYWMNTSDKPVKVVLHASGFYTEIFKK